jgi:hypothetical protein
MSSVRIRVENKIADCRNWFCLKHEIRIPPKNTENLLSSQHKKWVIISVFNNEYR